MAPERRNPRTGADGEGSSVEQQLAFLIGTMETMSAAIAQLQARNDTPPIVTPDPPQGDEVFTKVMNEFCKRKPPTFDGKGTTEDTENWLMEIEKVFTTLRTAEVHKVRLAAYCLQGQALKWWISTPESETPGCIWAEFLLAFTKAFFSKDWYTQKLAEFVNLKQGHLSVSEYRAKFRELLRYAGSSRFPEEFLAQKFREGLKMSIQLKMAGHEVKTWEEVADKARDIERTLEKAQAENNERTYSGGPSRKRGF